MKDFINELESQIAVLKVYIHELRKENDRLNRKIKRITEEIDMMFPKNTVKTPPI
tara:strand:- start:780 stop:944 length:165 start_codon:yes stop_codon:yes gene_type:complete